MPLRDDLEVFRACRRACLDAVRRALDDDGPTLDDGQIGLLLDGAEVCETAIRFRRRNSALHPRVCVACVEICERGAELCGTFADDAVMRACGEACRRCAEVCRALTGAGPAGGASRERMSGPPWRGEADEPPHARARRSA